MTQTSNELSATHNAKKKKCLSFARERKARFHRSRRAISSAMTSRSGAPTFSSRARGRALQKTIARTFECPSFPRAFSPILDSKCRSKSTGVPLSLNREVFLRSSRFRVHATSRATSRARAPTQKCGFLSKRFALFRVLLLCASRRSSRFSFTSRAPNCNEMQNTKVTRREKKRDDQRHRHGSNELLFFLSFLLGPRASLAHSRSFFQSILGFQRISFFSFLSQRVFLLP